MTTAPINLHTAPADAGDGAILPNLMLFGATQQERKMSQNFLIEHDRHRKIPTRITVYDDWKSAEERLFRLDLEQLDELNACLKAGKPVRMEYVVISALSVETLKKTHGRYFWGEYEVLHPVEICYGAGLRNGRPSAGSDTIPPAPPAVAVADAAPVAALP